MAAANSKSSVSPEEAQQVEPSLASDASQAETKADILKKIDQFLDSRYPGRKFRRSQLLFPSL
jgi:hypothetical protein